MQPSGNGRPVFMHKSNLCCSVPFKDLVATLHFPDFWTKPSSHIAEEFRENYISFVAGYQFQPNPVIVFAFVHQATQCRSMMPRSSAPSGLGGLASAGPLTVGLSASQYFETTLLRTPNILRGQKLETPYRSTSLQNSCVKKFCT
jgi:hypothetical protein